MRKEITETVTKTKVTCDVCKKDCTPREGEFWPHCCSICGKDLCRQCDVRDNRDLGDYPVHYCVRCWEIGEPFRDEMGIAEEKHDVHMDSIELKWHKACKDAAQ